MRKNWTEFRYLRLCAIAGLAVACGLGIAGQAAAGITYTGGTYSQNFDTLTTSTSSTAWANDSTLAGWSFFRAPAPGTAITTYLGGDGSSNTGSFYSFGSSASTDRAIGGLASGGAYFGSPLSTAVAGWIAVGITNGSTALNNVTVSFDGEEWRDGGFASGSTPQTMVLEYGFGTTFQTVSSWTAPGGSFDFTSPNVGAIAGTALNGNLAANRTAGLGGTISNLNWTTGQTLWLRWIENNDLGNDHALALDNFSLQAAAVPEPSSFLLAALGLVGMVAAFRRRRQRA